MAAPLRLALVQLNVTVGDLQGNLQKISGAIRSAQAWQADLLVVPELAVTGYPPEDLLLKPAFIDANLDVLARLAPQVRGLTACVGFVDRDAKGRLYNAAAVIAGGRVQAVYHKAHLPNYGVFDERRYFTPGKGPLIIRVGDVLVGVTICEDLWEAAPAADLAAAGAHLMVNLSASPYHAGKVLEREKLFLRRARENGLALAYCNLVGGQDELVFDGASLVVDGRGRTLARGAQFAEDTVVAELDFASVGRKRSRVRALQLPSTTRPRPPLPVRENRILSPLEEIYQALVVGLGDYVRKNGFSTVALGLSGGVDSALTACLAVDALGKNRVVGVVMPSRFSSRETQQDARQLAGNLGIRCAEASIEPIFKAYRKTVRPLFNAVGDKDAADAGITEQNLQARIRGNLLMALSNRFGWLVLTTGNKSEIATGYTTLYGDMAGGFAVIKDVPKTVVYALSRYRNRREGRPVIPISILRRAPTAELARNQTDQDTLPPYPVLDRLLKAYIEEDRSLQAIIGTGGASAEVVRKAVGMVDRSEYKRRQSPPGIKITPKAFGRDRRMPITNRWRG